MTDHQNSSAGSEDDGMRRIILALFNPMPDGHEKGCLANDPHIKPRGPCICKYGEAAGEYLGALREAKKIASEHYGRKEVEESRRLEEPIGLVEAAALVPDAAQPEQVSPSVEQVYALAKDHAQRWGGDDFALMDEDDKADLVIDAKRWLECWFAVASQPSPAATVETKSAPSLLASQQAELLPKREPAGGGADTCSSAGSEPAGWAEEDYQRARDCMVGILRGDAWTIRDGKMSSEFDNAFQHAVGILALTARRPALLARAKEMPSSLNDACRTIELLVEEIGRLRAEPQEVRNPSADSGDSKLPLQYEDGPDYCTVRDAQGRDFALTVQPKLMQAMENALGADIDRLRAAPQPPANNDYVQMPREATRAMTMAACDRLPSCEHVFGHAGEILRSVYEQMVKVAAVETSTDTAEPDVEARIAVLSDALKSISKNTCCDNCQEAAKVARSALGAYVALARTADGGKQ